MAFGFCLYCKYCRNENMHTFPQIFMAKKLADESIDENAVVKQIGDMNWFCVRHAPTKYLNDNDSIMIGDLFVKIDSTSVCEKRLGCGEFEI